MNLKKPLPFWITGFVLGIFIGGFAFLVWYVFAIALSLSGPDGTEEVKNVANFIDYIVVPLSKIFFFAGHFNVIIAYFFLCGLVGIIISFFIHSLRKN